MTHGVVTDLATCPAEKTSLPAARRTRRPRSAGRSLLAQGEPVVWLLGGGLVICVAMIVGLLLLVVYQGLVTFWPLPLVQLKTISGDVVLGEVVRVDHYELDYGRWAYAREPERGAIGQLLHPHLQRVVSDVVSSDRLQDRLLAQQEDVERMAVAAVQGTKPFQQATGQEQSELLATVRDAIAPLKQDRIDRFRLELAKALEADKTGTALANAWQTWRERVDLWLDQPTAEAMNEQLANEPELAEAIWRNGVLTLFSDEIAIPMRRRLIRTGNYELTNEHFRWVSDVEVEEKSEFRPEWALLFERLAWGRFYGIPAALLVDGKSVADEPAEIWRQFRQLHPEARQRWQQRRRFEIVDTGRVNRLLEHARLELRQVELDHGRGSAEWEAANRALAEHTKELEAEFASIRKQIEALDEENARYQLEVVTASGQKKQLALADIVRAYPANQLTLNDKLACYLSRWTEFLTDDPREANSEGGVFPAIWGTVAMTLLMSVAVVPFGVLAALYLREYAKAGWLVSTVRIAVNNLAGVPSIVFGVFGLGFFCYIIGASLDELFFAAKLPSPTFGTGGLMWAALTLALLTLPVVIVATEEALAAVPRSMREGSLACGATKWQTIRRIVLPRAMPGIMTGMILAMARGAGEVAPLMLVGAVKLAPELPVDGVFPYVHLERSFMHLGFHIYDLGFQSQNSEAAKPMVFTTTLLLIALIALMNLIAIWLRGRLQKKYATSQF